MWRAGRPIPLDFPIMQLGSREHMADDRLNQRTKQGCGLTHPLRLHGDGDVHALAGAAVPGVSTLNAKVYHFDYQ